MQHREMCLARFGIPTDQPATQQKLCSASHAVAPTPRYNPTGPAGPSSDLVPSRRRAFQNSRKRTFVLTARVTAPSQRDDPVPPRKNPRTLGFPATLVEFGAPSAHELKRVHSTPAYLTGYVPPSGFFTLTTVSSSLERPVLFHTGNAHGILLSRDFPSQPGPGCLSHSRLPSRRFSSHSQRIINGMRGVWHLQTSQPAARPIRRPQGFAPAVNPYRGRAVTPETQRPIPS
jgi:hypothetical protein